MQSNHRRGHSNSFDKRINSVSKSGSVYINDRNFNQNDENTLHSNSINGNNNNNNLEFILANTQNELYEALESEFKLKESLIGLERHVQMLASENKLLHNNRKKRFNVINLLQVNILKFYWG